MLPNLDLLEIEKELHRRSLMEFVRDAWHVLEPAMEFKHGWHLDAIAEHLEAITSGEILRLLVNVPPGTMKSLLSNVFWPAWEWGPKGLAHNRFIGASHEQNLAIRDNVKMRRLIESDWYQRRYPTNLMGDQNQKIYYENDATGFRQACSVRSMTGRRGDRVTWDDPHNVEGALSDKDRATDIRTFRETLPTRLNDPEKSAILVIMQRLHEGDVSGEILEGDYGYVHLCLPMEYEKARHCSTVIGFEDPRTEEGELLFPERFPAHVVERDKKVLGSHAVAGQFQQRPAPRSGGMFEWEKIKVVRVAPKMDKIVRYWDKAGTDGGGAYTAGVKMGVTADGDYYILDVVRGQWKAAKREPILKSTAALDGTEIDIWIEQEPGSGGKESAESTIKNLAGYSVYAERPTGEKAVRADPLSVQVEAGNVYMVQGPWNQAFIDELKLFPHGKYKDQTDAASGAFNKLALGSRGFFG